MLQSPNQSHTFIPDLSVKFCNRSFNYSGTLNVRTLSGQEIINKTRVIALSFYVTEPQIDGLVEEARAMRYHASGIPTITSSIYARPLRNIGSHVRMLVCNSIQLTMNGTGKLQQRFLSVVETSAETIIKSSRSGSISVTLYFDVLALNASRVGLLNDSHVKLLSLSDLQVSCSRRDQYGLNTETNEVVHVDMTKELIVTTSALIIDEKLRVYVNVSIPAVSDHSFGKYACLTSCKL